jgi:hypothetical protein
MKAIIIIALMFALSGCEVVGTLACKVLTSMAADAVVEAVKEGKK